MAFPPTPEFRFRGDRNYLHSTTVFDWLLNQDPQPTNIDFVFHKMTGFQCAVQFGNPKYGPKLVAVYQSDGLIAYLEETSIPIVKRYGCNEEQICEHVRLQGNIAVFEYPLVENATFIEVLIGAYKLLLTMSSHSMPGKLVFARCRLKNIFEFGTGQVVHQRAIGNFFEAQIRHEVQPIGHLYFGVK
jgi:hypothetical protein